MTGDTKWLIGTGVVLAGLLGGLLSAQIQGVSTSLSGRMERLENRFDGMDERLRSVEIALGKVDQRLLTIERVVLPGNAQPGE